MSVVKGMKDHLKKLGLLKPTIEEIAIKESKKFAESWKSEAKKNTPVDTGVLQKSWRKKVFSDNGTINIKIYNNTEYAEHVEYGHRTRNNGGIGYVRGFYMLKGSSSIYRQKVDDLVSTINEKVEKRCKI